MLHLRIKLTGFACTHFLFPLIACGAVVCTAGVTRGDDDTDRHSEGLVQELILGESPFPQARNELQITVSAEHLSGDEQNTTDLILEMEYGITDTFQVGFELPYGLIDGKEGEGDEDGVKDVGVGVLWNFLRTDGLVLSAAGEASLTNGDEDKELGEEDAEFEAMLLGSLRLGEAELYGGVGGEFTDDDEAFVYSAGIAVPAGPVVGLLEIAGTDGAQEEEDEAFFAPGVALELFDAFEALIGVPIGLNDHTPDWGLTVRVTVEF